ncbi:hypothetical protein DB346_23395 [Verrucomicrobia bacterium LW23]|nr:hypothetical protein DB346_23395 [Verrucomicrobia bacterium LW23]
MNKFILALIMLSLSIAPIFAAKHVKAGPRKGLLLELTGKNAEFFVEKDRKVSIVIYDAAMKPQAPSGEEFTATAEAASGKVKLEFEVKGDQLVSTTPLPGGEGYQVVVQAKADKAAKPKNFRIKLELYICKSCSNPEYACTCDE